MLAQIAEDYYVGGRSQEEIASELRISRSYVSRLLNRARAMGIVEFSINHPIATEPELETEIRRRFGLKRCIVVADVTQNLPETLRIAGRSAARYLIETIRPDDTLAISWGTGIRAVIEALKPTPKGASHVVQMFGGMSLNTYGISGPDLVAKMARALNATYEYLHAPWLVDSAASAEALMQQPDVAGALASAATANVAFVGVGATGQGSSSLLFNNTYLMEHELTELVRERAVGDIAGRAFNSEGRPCQLSFDDRIIGLDLDRLSKIPVVVGIATGEHKGEALLAAVKGGFVNAVVTDRTVALKMLRR